MAGVFVHPARRRLGSFRPSFVICGTSGAGIRGCGRLNLGSRATIIFGLASGRRIVVGA